MHSDSRRGAQRESTPSVVLGPTKSVDGWVVFVTNLHQDAQEDDVFDKFSEYGRVLQVKMNQDRQTCKGKGYALVQFEEQSAALESLQLHGTQLFGQPIFVNWAFVNPTVPSDEPYL